MSREYRYSVWGTQGGGLVREVNGTYIFVEKPDCPSLDVGDEMPEEWGVIPANNHARQKMDQDIIGTANCGCVYHAEQGIPCEHDLALRTHS